MKADIHPNYRNVVFQDTSSGDKFMTRSTVETSETVVWEDGNEYPLAKVEISAFTHPFYTGQMKIIDTAGRVERFQKRYGDRVRRPSKAAAAEAPAAAEGADAE
ncbi:MAG: type B 50S ribosomal protein L31 [Microthrixaceae bacterium]|nr:type B 50S ribosomal protein L31 [Microthrixaceae bacterium]MCO5313479.1 type B 50S ribosomal protein L31 [Microthrixaceae bacterium]HPB44797.1 type B 50S ribosomal protein L31 [Microthrixaceae bacterium]